MVPVPADRITLQIVREGLATRHDPIREALQV